jgi:two-component system, OmpR family, sensor kinase
MLPLAERPLNDNLPDLTSGDPAGGASQAAMEHRVAELMEAVAARDAFLAVATHELRNPMTPILAQVQRLHRVARISGGSDGEIAQGLKRLETLVEHYVRRATALLDVSRITSGKLHLTPEPFDLVELTGEIVEALRPAAQYIGSAIDLEAPAELPGSWDRLAMEQILDNLISNAVKYGAGRPIAVRVSREADGIALEVRDQGIGISSDDQARIFQRFERAVQRGSRAGGFGVGLWVVGQLVDAMKGRIVVKSEPNRGSTFTVCLPLRQTGLDGMNKNGPAL